MLVKGKKEPGQAMNGDVGLIAIGSMPLSKKALVAIDGQGIKNIYGLKQWLKDKKPLGCDSKTEKEILDIASPYLEKCGDLPVVPASEDVASLDEFLILEDPNLSVRAGNILRRMRKQGPINLSEITYQTLMGQAHCGKKTAGEILKKIGAYPKARLSKPIEVVNPNFSAMLGRSLTDKEIAIARSLRIQELSLPVRAFKVLSAMQIKKATAILRLDPSELLRHSRCGKKTIKDIRNLMEKSLSDAALIQTEFKNKAWSTRDFVDDMLKALSPNVKDIVMSRNGLWDGDEDTLASLGKRFAVTRERIRQIQAKAEIYLKNSLASRKVTFLMDYIKKTRIKSFFNAKQGLAKKEEIQNDLFVKDADKKEAIGFRFIMDLFPEHKEVLLSNVIVNEDGDVFENRSVLALYEKTSSSIKRALSSVGKPLAVSQLIEELEKDGLRPQNGFIQRCVEISPSFGFDGTGNVGFRHWKFFKTEGIREMAQRALVDLGVPSHFTHVADRMNLLFPARAPFVPSSVHNCLLAGEDVFVLVERGKYGLVNWGVSRRPFLKDFLVKAITDKGGMADANTLVKEGQEKFDFNKNSILMTLSLNGHIFKKIGKDNYQVT